jgi:glycine oxidase
VHSNPFAYDIREMRLSPPTSSLSALSDVVIIGAGIIGLSLALELHARGARVTVLERDSALSHASAAAAGMLAAQDPHNPPALLPLSTYSLSLYPAFLHRIQTLSSLAVPFQTDTTLQHLPNASTLRLAEHSLDPRQLAPALLAAVSSTSINLREHTPLLRTEHNPRGGSAAHTSAGDRISASHLVYTTGPWPPSTTRPSPISPRKGQMLRVQLPPSLANLRGVHRSEHIYIVPRTFGPQAGTALIGATVEDAGFDTAVHSPDLARLRSLAAELLPALADTHLAPEVESWAGLRPSTPDSLPILGRLNSSQEFIATGHYRNGILLAPATAAVLADLLESRTPTVDLTPFAPSRFG